MPTLQWLNREGALGGLLCSVMNGSIAYDKENPGG